MFSIYYPNLSQREYIVNLLLLTEVLPEVRCKWHPEEDIKDMGIKYTAGYIPTFQAQCPQDPTTTNKTTIYTYSWKTSFTAIIKASD